MRKKIVLLLISLIPLSSFAEGNVIEMDLNSKKASIANQSDLRTDKCFQMVDSSKKTGRLVYLSSIMAIPLLDDPQYIESNYSEEIICLELKEKGPNDAAWSLGARRAFGCICSTVLNEAKL